MKPDVSETGIKQISFAWNLWENVFSVIVLFLSTGAVIPLLQTTNNMVLNPLRGDIFMQSVWLGIYVITFLLLLKRSPQVLSMVFSEKLLWLLVGLAIVSVVWSVTPIITMRRSLALLGTTLLGIYLAARYTRRELLRILAWMLGLIAVLSAGFALLLPSYGIHFKNYNSFRGIFENKNTLACYMAFAALIWLLHSFSCRRERILGFVFCAISITLLFLAKSVTGLTVFFVCLIMLLICLVAQWSSLRTKLPLYILLVSVAILMFWSANHFDLVLTVLGRDATLTGRTVLWQWVWYMIQQHPWLGYGYNAFWLGLQGPSSIIWQHFSWKPANAHNGYLDLWLELGLVGMVFFALSLFANLYKAIWLIWKRNGPDKMMPLLFFFFLMVYNIPESSILDRNSIFWILYVAFSLQLRVDEKGETFSKDLKKKVVILTNIIAPYRLPIYRSLADHFRLHVLFSGWEDNRDSWGREHSQEKGINIKRAWGFTFKIPKKRNSKLFDYWYLHINPGYLWELIKIRPDAVLTNEMGFRTLTALFYGSLFRKPVWVCWEGTVHTEQNIGFLKTITRKLIARWTRRWISFGDTSTEYLLSMGIQHKHIIQVQNCVDEKWFTDSNITPALNIRPKPVVLYAGQLIGRKGVGFFLEAAARVQSEGHIFSLLLVGGGSDLDELVKRAAELKIRNIHFHHPVKASMMAGIYKSADIFVFPTLEDVWGLVVNEALWSGLPVLCSKYAGCAKELLPPESVFNPLDPEDFSAALKRALSGKLCLPDERKLKTCQEVSQMIACELKGVL